MSDRFKFRALFENIATGEMIWQLTQPNHLVLTQGFLQKSDWLQCTGLKDKNGVLAFESDFAKSSMEGGHAIYPIEWDDEEKCLLWGGYALSRLVDNGFEVVGNKFQNPELLELTND